MNLENENKEEQEVPPGYGSVYPNSYWSGTNTPKETETRIKTIEPKETLVDKLKNLFK